MHKLCTMCARANVAVYLTWTLCVYYKRLSFLINCRDALLWEKLCDTREPRSTVTTDEVTLDLLISCHGRCRDLVRCSSPPKLLSLRFGLKFLQHKEQLISVKGSTIQKATQFALYSIHLHYLPSLSAL